MSWLKTDLRRKWDWSSEHIFQVIEFRKWIAEILTSVHNLPGSHTGPIQSDERAGNERMILWSERPFTLREVDGWRLGSSSHNTLATLLGSAF